MRAWCWPRPARTWPEVRSCLTATARRDTDGKPYSKNCQRKMSAKQGSATCADDLYSLSLFL